jgi:hypothetical protein
MPSSSKEATMNSAVTVCTNGDPIVYVKAKLWKICKSFDVMGVKLFCSSTLDAFISIAFTYRRAPFIEAIRVSRPSSLKRLPIFPPRRAWSNAVSVAALCRAESHVTGRKITEMLAAIQTWLGMREYAASRPAGLRAESRSGTIAMCLKQLCADFTDKLNSCSTAKNWFPFNRWHGMIISLSPQYCDVIVARYEQATGKKAVLSAG